MTNVLDLLKGLSQRFSPVAPVSRLVSDQAASQAVVSPPASAGLILIVELDRWTGAALPRLLEQAGFSVQIVGGEAIMEVLGHTSPLLLIVGGTAERGFYQALRAASTAPLLALVPFGNEELALSAFEAGVDQCQTGYVSDVGVLAWVYALLRRQA